MLHYRGLTAALFWLSTRNVSDASKKRAWDEETKAVSLFWNTAEAHCCRGTLQGQTARRTQWSRRTIPIVSKGLMVMTLQLSTVTATITSPGAHPHHRPHDSSLSPHRPHDSCRPADGRLMLLAPTSLPAGYTVGLRSAAVPTHDRPQGTSAHSTELLLLHCAVLRFHYIVPSPRSPSLSIQNIICFEGKALQNINLHVFMTLKFPCSYPFACMSPSQV